MLDAGGNRGTHHVVARGAPMTRVFRRGELRVALLQVLGELGTANGYAIMHGLAERVGAGWRPSPGAIYPALLALEDAGHITGCDVDGARLYSLTPAGRRLGGDRSDLLDDVARRASSRPVDNTIGTVLDAFAARSPHRSILLDPQRAADVASILATAESDISSTIDQGART